MRSNWSIDTSTRHAWITRTKKAKRIYRLQFRLKKADTFLCTWQLSWRNWNFRACNWKSAATSSYHSANVMFSEIKETKKKKKYFTKSRRQWRLSLFHSAVKRSSFDIFLVDLQSHTRRNLFSRNYVARAVTFILFLLFPKLFAGAVPSPSDDSRYTRVRETRLLKHGQTYRAHFRGVNCLCRTRVVKKQLLAASSYLRTALAAAAAAAGQGLPRVYLTETSGRRAVDSQRK